MALPADEVGSFLAFLYRIRFDPVYRARFTWPQGYDRTTGVLPPNANTLDYAQVMQEFNLTQEQMNLMVAVDWAEESLDLNRKALALGLWEELVKQLIPEFRKWALNKPLPLWW